MRFQCMNSVIYLSFAAFGAFLMDQILASFYAMSCVTRNPA